MEAEYFSTFSVAVTQKRSRTEGVKPQTCYLLAQSPALGNTGVLNLHLPGDSCPPPSSIAPPPPHPVHPWALPIGPNKISPSSMHPSASSPQPSPRLPSPLPVPLSPNWLVQLLFFSQCIHTAAAAAKLLSHARLLATPWTGAYQAPPSMGFSRQEYQSGMPLLSPIHTAARAQIKRCESSE